MIGEDDGRSAIPGKEAGPVSDFTGGVDGHEIGQLGVRRDSSDEGTLDSKTGGEEGVEALDEGWITPEEGRDSLDDTGSIDGLSLEEFHDL